MSDRRVTFQITTPSRSHRHRDSGNDSGVGSSSSGHASSGGRLERRFTAEDHQVQLHSIPALQEALGQANRRVDQLETKCAEMDADLTKAHRVAKDTDRLYRDEFERAERLNNLVKDLEEEVAAQKQDIKNLKEDLERVRDERDDYRQKYYNKLEPADTTMRGGSGEPSPRLRRSVSRHDPDRANRTHGEENAGSSRHHRRRSSISVNPGAANRRPYIERMPGDPPRSSHRYSGNYTTTIDTTSPVINDPLYAVPRTSPSATGNYVPYPLHEPHGHRRG
ncbi:hypothetical protein F4821DRAFT_146045 [Hypoxylon rubiginosum]|uniref:Uncharacterized protein n=1 Tax=Hypoxylon rubiginosum TaxID=110542 RepID=A0ACC0CZS3_9PEZI|nr:hypothetical protein F4821DRAFT_146045 [Hypoxylon rubiginosum]